MLNEEQQRQAIVDEAMTWLRTKYHHMGRVKGGGVDCATLVAQVFINVGLIPDFKVEHYPHDWHLHRDAERYMEKILSYAREVDKPEKGGLALFKFGRVFSHGAIITDWPMCIHAYIGRNVELVDVDRADWLRYMNDGKTPRPVKFYSLWGG